MNTRFVLDFVLLRSDTLVTHGSTSVFNDLNYCVAMQDFADQKVEEEALPEDEKERHSYCIFIEQLVGHGSSCKE